MGDGDPIIDLHMHSVHSDGTCTAQQLIDMLAAKGVGIISFTDHDSVGCYRDLRSGRATLEPGMTLVPGVTISSGYIVNPGVGAALMPGVGVGARASRSPRRSPRTPPGRRR